MPGCTLTAFANQNYEEPFQEFDSVATHTNIVGYIVTNGCAKAFGSIRCRCSMNPIDCTATDVWQESLTCDNIATSEPKDCTHRKTIGTKFGIDLSQTNSTSLAISEAISFDFQGEFSGSLGVSSTTGYDWTKSTSVTRMSQTWFEVKATAAPYTVLKIDQTVGKCGDSTVHTELFRIRHLNATGHVISSSTKMIKEKDLA